MPTIKKQDMFNPGLFKRMNYFQGMLLEEEDFTAEQTYLREKFKLHNRLHGTGVVWGLTLSKKVVRVNGVEKARIFIEPGLALDCAGNEITNCQDYMIPLYDKILEMTQKGELQPAQPLPRIYIGLRYCDCKSDPKEQYTAECPEDRLMPHYSRVKEGFKISLLTGDEYNQCPTKESTPLSNCGCTAIPACSEDDMVVYLGYVENFDVSADQDSADAIVVNFEPALRPHLPFNNAMGLAVNWEYYKHVMIQTVLREQNWVDVSFLIGKSIYYFKSRFTQDTKLQRGIVYVPGSEGIANFPNIIKVAKKALPWAYSNPQDTNESDIVDVVTNDKGTCIIFPLVRKPLAIKDLDHE